MKKMFTIILSITLLLINAVPAFASSFDDVYFIDNVQSYDVVEESSMSDSIIVNSNRYRTVKEVVYTSPEETTYSSNNLKKVIYTETHYKVYEENIGTGVRHFQYDEFVINWRGYKRDTVSSYWVYVKSGSDTNRVHFDSSEIGQLLMSF